MNEYGMRGTLVKGMALNDFEKFDLSPDEGNFMAKSRKLKNGQKTKRRRRRTPPPSLLNLKVTEAERRELIKNANLHTNGNLSAWLRVAGRFYKPKLVLIR